MWHAADDIRVNKKPPVDLILPSRPTWRRVPRPLDYGVAFPRGWCGAGVVFKLIPRRTGLSSRRVIQARPPRYSFQSLQVSRLPPLYFVPRLCFLSFRVNMSNSMTARAPAEISNPSMAILKTIRNQSPICRHRRPSLPCHMIHHTKTLPWQLIQTGIRTLSLP